MSNSLLVLGGGAVGAAARYLIGLVTREHLRSQFHWGTFAANMIAALLLGFAVRAGSDGRLDPAGQALLATGFCGALSTWSTLSREALSLITARQVAEAALYLTVTVACGIGLSYAGAALAQAV